MPVKNFWLESEQMMYVNLPVYFFNEVRMIIRNWSCTHVCAPRNRQLVILLRHSAPEKCCCHSAFELMHIVIVKDAYASCGSWTRNLSHEKRYRNHFSHADKCTQLSTAGFNHQTEIDGSLRRNSRRRFLHLNKHASCHRPFALITVSSNFMNVYLTSAFVMTTINQLT